MEISLWISLFLIIYTYIGYGLLLYVINKFIVNPKNSPVDSTIDKTRLPSITILIAAYNEEDYIEEKIKNTLELDYPRDLMQIAVVSDGSNDNTNQIVREFEHVKLLFQEQRAGKSAAINRAFDYLTTDLVLLTDANVYLNESALTTAASHFKNPAVGIVSGEKKVISKQDKENASDEGIYWKYESFLKNLDSHFYSTMGAPGEFLLIRRNLFIPIPTDTILDDFEMSLDVIKKGFKIAYEPRALAIEYESANIKEEMKRKIRISAGGIQAIMRNLMLFNIFKYGRASFQFVSHRVLRWTITPIALICAFIINTLIVSEDQYHQIYIVLFSLQLLFYFSAIIGWLSYKLNVKIKGFNIPFYFCFMNYSSIIGMKNYFLGKSSALWDKAERSA